MICTEKNCCFTSLPLFLKERSVLTSPISFHGIHVQIFARILLQLQSNLKNVKVYHRH